jgi:O-antigen/teichoic acid export membrane protein
MTALFGLERAGDYAAAADLVVRGMGLVVAPVVMFLHPAFMRMWNTDGPHEALRSWRRTTLLLAGATMGAACVAIIAYLALGDVLLDHLIPFAAFAVVSFTAAVWQLGLMVHKPLEASGRTRTMLLTLIFSLLVTLGLNLALAVPFAETGVATAAAGGALFYIVATTVLNKRVLAAFAQDAKGPAS